jgi:hypothetical protein
MKVESEVVSFSFYVYKRIEINPKIQDILQDFVGPSFDWREWILEVEVRENGYQQGSKFWNVHVTAGYVG